MKKKIAIQGIKGCFHEIATKKLFSKIDYDIIECKTFNELTHFVSKFTADIGVLAIENSIAGVLIYNLFLIKLYNLKISREIYLPINHNLLILKNSNIKNIKKIISHPMAILQCKNYISKYRNIKISESVDTAEAASFIFKNKNYYIGAIASEEAATAYNLKIVDKNIQTVNKNFTRFLIINNNHKYKKISLFEKASFYFRLKNLIGELSKILNIISYYDINITSIQTFPIKKKPWEYLFFIDIKFFNTNNYFFMKKEINKINNYFYVIGEYKD
ncbi:prephenate dehydratase [Candidatus Karelsulcia muelleri]|uniref:prephenate dehydratase n=1 Tax=Candidatus Karelsulcia muelleri TaxID=336810 RepID=UPI0009BFFC68|nr:prephenate dehydratase domain-containing protein [Candidatus Karelsulcia muelleri]MBU6942309.1 prephenate dehydratase [Candidatus Karelsulcia muelleri]